jgi:ABC-2 type transport system permease protein
LKKILILLGLELRILLKDRQALGLLFIMPTVLILFLTLALKDVYLAKVGYKSKILVVTGPTCDSSSSLCNRILDQLKKFEYDFKIVSEHSETYRDPVTLLFPKDISHTVELLKKGESLAETDQVQLIFDPTLDQSFRALVAGNLLTALQSVLILQVKDEVDDLKIPKWAPKFKIPNLVDVGHFQNLVVEKAWGGVILPNPIQQMVPAWALFGMFFIVIPLSNSVIRDRRLGVFKRLLSFPVGKWHLIIGKILPFFSINLIQFTLMFLMGIFVLPKLTQLNLPLDFNLFSVAVVTLVCAWTATSYGLMISSLCQTSEQASAFGSLSVVILAVIGGVMIPRFVMPDFMQQLSQISPLYWGLEAYQDLLVRKNSFESLIPKLGVLFCFSLIFTIISSLKFRWSEAN